MKKTIIKAIVSFTLCLCMILPMSIMSFAASITINHTSNSSTGYSSHTESTPNGVYGYSMGNCVHNSADNVYYYADVHGASTYKRLYSYLKPVNQTLNTVISDQTKTTSITHNPSLTFNRSVKTDIVMIEQAFTGTDLWMATYKYTWNYYSAQSRMTLVSGTYTKP